MKTHNFYADLVLSLRTFFDRIVFPNNEIKGYRFNIGNRSLQLNYETKFDLPWMLVEYQSSRHVTYHAHTWLKTQYDNTSKYPVLYNKSKNLSLLMQEELYEFQIQATLNCESQLQSLEYKHAIERFLVVGKYFQLYSFFSFFTINDKLLHEDIFDVNKDELYNIFMRYDHLRDETVYCYSVKYEPLVRIDSSEASINSAEQRSFPLVMQLNIINPMPIYTEIPVYERAKPLLKKVFEQRDVFIPLDRTYSIASVQLDVRDVGKRYVPAIVYGNTYNCDLVYAIYNPETEVNDFEFSGNLSGDVEKTKCIGQFKTIVADVNYTVDYERIVDVDDGIVIIRLFGPISGVIVQVKPMTQYGPGYVRGWFNGMVEGVPAKINIEGELISEAYVLIFGKHAVTISESSHTIDGYQVVPQPYGNLNHLIVDFNPKLLRLNVTSTVVKEIVFYYNFKLHTLPIDITFDPAGNFKQSFEYTIGEVKFEGCVFGKLDPITMAFSSDTRIEDERFKVVALKCDFKFKSSVGYGAPIIDKLNINVTDMATPVSSALGSATYFKNEFIELDDRNNKLLLQNIILSMNDITEFAIPIEDTDQIKVKVNLASNFDFDSAIVTDELYWRFYLNLDRTVIDTNTVGISILERTEDDSPNILYFQCSEEIFDEYFRSKIDVDNPIFFQLYKLY